MIKYEKNLEDEETEIKIKSTNLINQNLSVFKSHTWGTYVRKQLALLPCVNYSLTQIN
jgi:hypothetical protein